MKLNEENPSVVERKILRWNFPTFGEKYLTILNVTFVNIIQEFVTNLIDKLTNIKIDKSNFHFTKINKFLVLVLEITYLGNNYSYLVWLCAVTGRETSSIKKRCKRDPFK